MERIEKMKQLKNQGLSYGAIAKMFNLSRARIHQLISGYRSKDNSDLKQTIFKRDDYKCQWGEVCKGEDVYRKDLIIHHIDFDNTNNEMGNLITLCSKCHAKFHSQNHIDPEIEKKLLNKERQRKLTGIRNKYLIKFWEEKDLSMKEIGEIFGIGIGRVYSILKEDREKKLLKRLKRKGGE